ncbi:MAG: hypothetical protein ACR2M1_02945 [Gemmatimonadaceae bacterium]
MKFASLTLIVGLISSALSTGHLNAQKPAPARPLERLAAEHMLVLPVQYLVFSDSMGWSALAPSSRTYLSTLDDEITFALGERGLTTQWKFPADVARSVARNTGYAPDPHALAANQVRFGVKSDAWQLTEPLASQLRSLVALTDARYVMLPVEVRVTGGHSTGRAMLHVVVIDARRSQIQWAGDVVGTPVTKFSPAIAADLASRLADLVAAQTN